MEGSEDGIPEITNVESQAATRNRSSRQQPLKGNKSAKDNTVTPQRKSKRRRKEAEWMNELKVKRKASTRPGKTETESHRKADPSKVKMKIVNVKSLQPKGEDPDFEVAKSLSGAHSCQECKMRFKTKVAFNLHRHKAHGYMKGSETMCKLCGKQANFAYRLEVHKLYMCRQIVRNYECDVCKLKFKTVTERAKHPCTKIPRRPFYCTQKNCPFKARKITILIEHLSRHFGVKSYLCGTCGNPFTSKKELDNHMDIHKASKDWMCQECGKSYKCKHSLLAHLRKHRNKGRYKCELCPYTSPVYDGYKQHMLRHREPAFKCEVCGLSLKRAINLRVHMEKKHNPSRIFACKHCDYTTNKGQGFASHMRRHKNVGQNSENDEAYTTGDEPISTDHAMLEQGTSTQGFASPTTYFSISNLPPPVTPTPPLRGSGNTLPTSDCRLNQSILGDPSLIYDGEVNILGTNADTMMGNIVSTATSQDIGMITSDSPSTSLNLYSTESINNGPTSIALPNLILSESITSMNAEETWTACEQTSLNG